ncbi:MAG: hypothetical protein LBK23_05105 [Oscillospiraceae bacterium]|jgi:hypothetical protein|nr:hypothetical protein [Oscillospiraceae bacterium]
MHTIRPITRKQAERVREQDAVGYVRFTMACEGMPLNKRETDRLNKCASGELSVDVEVAKLVKHYLTVGV